MVLRLTIVAVLGIIGASAFEQDQTAVAEQPRCWLASIRYSPGATVRAGNEVKICGPDFTWLPTTDWASGCIHESEFFSVGDVRQDYAQQRVPSRASRTAPGLR